MYRAYKYRLKTSKTAERKIDSAMEVCRQVYNIFIRQRRRACDIGFKRQGKPISIGKYTQQKQIKHLRKVKSGWSDVYSMCIYDACWTVDESYKAFFAAYKVWAKQPDSKDKLKSKPRQPRAIRKGRYSNMTYQQSGFKLSDDNRWLNLSFIGDIRIIYHREHQGVIKNVTVKREFGKYYAILECELPEPKKVPGTKAVGIDVGIQKYVTTSDGKKYPPLDEKPLWAKKRKLQQVLSRRQKGSNRYKKQKELLAKHEAYIARRRRDYAHKIAYALVTQYDLIYRESLDIKDMIQTTKYGKNMRKGINRSAWGEFFNILEQKAHAYGKSVIDVPSPYTSKRCSNCWRVNDGLELSDRTFICPACGYENDRDINAAINIKLIGQGYLPFGLSVSGKVKKSRDRQK